MSIFNFGSLSDDRIVELAQLSIASYEGGTPPSGWSTLTGTTLGFDDGLFTPGSYDGETYVGGVGFFGSPAARVYRNGSDLAISFRGTDDSPDYATYVDILGNNNYINAFNSLLDTVHTFASDPANGISQVYVTGHSLGGAAANILRNVSDEDYDGFYDDAIYFSLATPKVSGNPQIFNIGFENDWVFKVLSRLTPFASSDFVSTTDNFILYDDAYSDPDFPGLVFGPGDTTAHDSNGYVDAIRRVTESHFYEEMARDSLVIVVDTGEQVSNKETSTADQFGESAFFVGRDANDDILGGPQVDFIDGGDGEDTIAGGPGADELHGGDGDDLFLGAPADLNGDTIEDLEFGDRIGVSGATVNEETLESEGGVITFVAGGTSVSINAEVPNGFDLVVADETLPDGGSIIELLPVDGQDIAFVIDTTGSMRDDITNVKSQATSIIDAIFDPDRGLANSRVAVVGYNDPSTETILSFTDQPDPEDRKAAALTAINGISVSGGGDFPEMTFNGLLRALDGRAGEWREDAVARKIILFGDATAKDTDLAPQVYALARNLGAEIDDRTDIAAMSSAMSTTDLSESVSVTTFEVMEADSATGALSPVPVQIFAVAIGGNTNTQREFETIATETGGEDFRAADASEIVDTLLEVIRLPIYSITASTNSVAEGDDGSTTVTVTLRRDTGGQAAVVSLLLEGTANAADRSLETTDVSFAVDETEKTVELAISGDTEFEPDETVTVTIDSVSVSATLGTRSTTVTITNDDADIETIDGTSGNDRLIGTASNELIRGLDGDDLIDGMDGSDSIFGGDGLDYLIGGGGDDFIYGGETVADLRDLVFSGSGNDFIDGGHGNDDLNAGDGDDTVLGGFGADKVVGNSGNDTLNGGAGSDEVFGGPGADFLTGGWGHDRMNGGTGADRFFHQGLSDHGSDWIQDFSHLEGDVLLFGIPTATGSDFLVQFAQTPGAGEELVQEAFVIYRPTGQIMWALVDGAAESSLIVQVNNSGVNTQYDLLA